MLPDHPLCCEPFTQVVGDEFWTVIATQDCRNTVGLERGLEDSQRATGKFVGEGQDLQRRPLAGLIEDEIVGPDVVRIFGLQRKMLSCMYFPAQPLGREEIRMTLISFVHFRRGIPKP